MIRERVSIHRLAAAGFFAVAMSVGAPALAQSTDTAVPAAATSGQTVEAVSVEGFRSARFGMDQAAVREAIATDFALEGEAVVEADNPAERTEVLSIAGVEALEGGGEADVSYVFGYRSGTLSQVSVLWAAEPDGTLAPEQLLANADVLLAYFLSAGYEPDSIITSVVVPEGLVVFRGADAEGRMTVLLLRGASSQTEAEGDAPAQSIFTPTGLLLAYLSDPENPDVFQVERGQF